MWLWLKPCPGLHGQRYTRNEDDAGPPPVYTCDGTALTLGGARSLPTCSLASIPSPFTTPFSVKVEGPSAAVVEGGAEAATSVACCIVDVSKSASSAGGLRAASWAMEMD